MRFVPRRFRLLIFDWDGTLADSTGVIAASLQQACADLGLTVPTEREARHVIGLGLADALKLVAPDLPRARHSELAMRYRAHFLLRDPEIPLYAGAVQLLRDLRAAGYRLAIATGKTRRGLDRALTQHDLQQWFEHTRCADESPPKPDPDMLNCIMRAAGAAREQVLMIGDTSHDIELARNAGVAALAVSYGAHERDDLMRHEGVPVVHSVEELAGWLGSDG